MFRVFFIWVILGFWFSGANALTFKSGQSLSQSKQWQFIEMPDSPIDNLTLPTKFPIEVNNRYSEKNRRSLKHKLRDDFYFQNDTVNKCITNSETLISPFDKTYGCPFLFALDFYRTGSVESFTTFLLNIARQDALQYRVLPNDFSPARYQSRAILSTSSAFYALYYDFFDFSSEERDLVDTYLLDQIKSMNMDEVGEYKNSTFCNPRNHDIIGVNRPGRVDINTCESNRWKATVAQLLMGMRFQDEELFKRGIYNTRFMLLLFDERGIFVPWATRGALAIHYSFDVPAFLTTLTEIYHALGYDFLNHELENRLLVKDIYPLYFDILFKDKNILKSYSDRQWAQKGESYSRYLKRSTVSEAKRWHLTKSQIARESYRFIREHGQQFSDMIECDYQTRDSSNEPKRIMSGFNLIDQYDLYLMNQSKYDPHKEETCLASKHKSSSLEPVKLTSPKPSPDFDWSQDKYNGSYDISWFAENVHDPNVWIKGAVDKVVLANGKGTFITATEGLPGNKIQRSSLNISYFGDNGKIILSGELGLFEAERKYPTELIGFIDADFIIARWQEGDRIKLSIKKSP